MITKQITNFRTLSFAFVMAAVLMVGTMMPVQQAQAATESETSVVTAQLETQQLLQALVKQLQETLLKLERQITIEHGQKSNENLINQSSVAYTNEEVSLYEGPDYKSDLVATQDADVLGEVMAGPRLVDGAVWWKFEFRESGKEGWSPEKYFTRAPSVVLRVDTDQDGIHDASMRFIGEYNVDQFYAERGQDGTYIRYRGDSGVEPFSVTEL